MERIEVNLEIGETRIVALTDAEIASMKPALENLEVLVRSQRDALLAASDWTQVSDAPIDQAAWAAYRQELRDIPQQAGFPTDVVWPTTP